MTKTKKSADELSERPVLATEDLRHHAETKLKANNTAHTDLENLSSVEILRLVHELQVHQIELEMQNEELHKVQTELQQSQAEYISLYEHAPVGYLTLNTKNVILAANVTAARLLGCTKSDLIGHSLSELIEAEDQDIYYLHCQQLLQGKEHHSCELRVLTHDNNKSVISLESTLLRDDSNEPLQFRIVISDITQRKHAETELQYSRLHLQAIIDTATNAIITINSQGIVQIYNTAAETMFGYLAEEIIGHNINKLMPSPYREAHNTYLANYLQNRKANGIGLQREVQGQRKDGSIFPLVISLGTFQQDSQHFFTGILQDISERKHQEQQQRIHQHHYERLLKLEVANQTLAAIAHELNQPLNAVASYIDAAQRFLQKEECKENKLSYALDQSAEQAHRAGQVVHELFNFLHVGEVITTSVDLNKVVIYVLTTLKGDGCLSRFSTKLDLAKTLPPVRVNALQLEKVLINLIRNSIEAMTDAGMDQGAIVVTVSTAADSSSALISISDNGPGLSDEAIRHVFDPFYSTKADGLGMGLAISRALIEAQGGQLWCQSNESTPGVTFHLTLPFAAETSA